MSTPLRILSALIGDQQAQTALKVLEAAGYVCVPRNATPKMLEDGWAAANEENAAATWGDMVESALSTQETENQDR